MATAWDDADDALPAKDSRGWAMRRGHCRRLRAEKGRESRRGRAAFARSINVDGFRDGLAEEVQRSLRRGRRTHREAEVAEALEARRSLAAAPAVPTAQHGVEEAGSWRWKQAQKLARQVAAAWKTASRPTTASGGADGGARRERAARPPPSPLLTVASFEELREHFLGKHRQEIIAALRKVFNGEVELKPAPLSSHLEGAFLQRCRAGQKMTLEPVLHGTQAANHGPIFEKGLMVPNASNGVRVCNGSSHGLGVYTSKLCNPYLSRGFCSEPRMLVCAVLDDAVPLTQPWRLGRFFVTAESPAVRHVGDAIVVMDPSRLAPLFEAVGGGFSTSSSFVPLAAVPASVAPSSAPSSVPQVNPVAEHVFRKYAAVEKVNDDRRSRAIRRRERKASTQQPSPAGRARFLARRSVQRRLRHASAMR